MFFVSIIRFRQFGIDLQKKFKYIHNPLNPDPRFLTGSIRVKKKRIRNIAYNSEVCSLVQCSQGYVPAVGKMFFIVGPRSVGRVPLQSPDFLTQDRPCQPYR